MLPHILFSTRFVGGTHRCVARFALRQHYRQLRLTAAVSHAGSACFKRGFIVEMIHLNENFECTFLLFLTP